MELNKLYKYRAVWMGLAILWVVFFHSGTQSSNLVFRRIEATGYGGVDIFLFASGLGNFYSYTKDNSPLDFILRRIVRLAPAYLLFMAVWLPYKVYIDQIPIKAIIGNIFAIQSFSRGGNAFNWYMSGLVIVYLLTPYFVEAIKRINRIFHFILFISFLLILSFVFWDSDFGLIIMARLPIYAIGMYFAKLEKYEHKKATKKNFAIAFIAVVIGVAMLFFFSQVFSDNFVPWGLSWYPFILIAPNLCMIISLLMECSNKFKVTEYIKKMLAMIGDLSFEIYLTHIFLFELYRNILAGQRQEERYAEYIWLVYVMICAASMVLHYIANRIKEILICKIRGRKE